MFMFMFMVYDMFVMSILYTHLIPVFYLYFNRFYYINKGSNAVNVKFVIRSTMSQYGAKTKG